MAEIRDSQELLREEIMADAERQAARIKRRAEREAQKIRDSEGAAAAAFRTEHLAQAETTARQRRELLLAKVPVEIRRLRAISVEESLEQVRTAVLERLQHGKTSLSRRQLLRLIAKPLAAMEGENFVVQLNNRERKLLGDDFAVELAHLSGKEGVTLTWGNPLPEAESGPVIADPSGKQRWDNRLTSRLQRMWPALRRALAQQTGLAHHIAVGEDEA